MKKILAAILCSWCGLALAQTAEELLNKGKNTENVTTFGMGYDLKMYSPLKQINKSNVKRLVPIWSFSTSNDMGDLSQPTVYNGVMYVVNGNWTFAIDMETGRQIWRTPVNFDRGALRVAGGGALMRGPATIYNGKLFRQTLDAHVIALDMKTGKEIWKQKYADFKEGYKGVIAPMIANGVLISGMGGGETTTRGFVEGYDPETGKRLWRTYTIPAPGEPGSETWPHPDQARRVEIRRRLHLAIRIVRSAARSSFISAPAMPSPITRCIATAPTACIPRASSRSGPRPVKWPGITRRYRTTPTISIRPPRACSPTSRSTASRARC